MNYLYEEYKIAQAALEELKETFLKSDLGQRRVMYEKSAYEDTCLSRRDREDKILKEQYELNKLTIEHTEEKIRQLEEKITDLWNELEDKQKEYTETLREHEKLTEQITRLEKSVLRFSDPEKHSERIKEIDYNRYLIHRKLEEIARHLGKSEHEVRHEILAWRYNAIPEISLPGLIILPHYPTNFFGIDTSSLNDNFLKESIQPPSRYINLTSEDNQELQIKKGYILIYNMVNEYGGDMVAVEGTTEDLGHDLKEQRIKNLLTYLNLKYPEFRAQYVKWVTGSTGVYHKFDNSVFFGFFIAENESETALEQIIKIMKENSSTLWITPQEYQELCTKLVEESNEGFGKLSLEDRLSGDEDEELIRQMNETGSMIEEIKAKIDLIWNPLSDFELENKDDVETQEARNLASSLQWFDFEDSLPKAYTEHRHEIRDYTGKILESKVERVYKDGCIPESLTYNELKKILERRKSLADEAARKYETLIQLLPPIVQEKFFSLLAEKGFLKEKLGDRKTDLTEKISRSEQKK